MPRPFAPKAAIFVCLGLLAAAPVRAQSLYLDWLSGWSTSAPGDYLRIALDPETGIWGPAPVEQALQHREGLPTPSDPVVRARSLVHADTRSILT